MMNQDSTVTGYLHQFYIIKQSGQLVILLLLNLMAVPFFSIVKLL